VAVSITGEHKEILPVKEGKKYRYLDQSPDGSMVAYVVCAGRNCDVWVMPSNGGTSAKIISHPGYDDTPRWSPDGTKIAFTSSRSGSFDVWVADLDVEDLKSELAISCRQR
jgi:TolB protein